MKVQGILLLVSLALAAPALAQERTLPLSANVSLTCVVEMGNLTATPACGSVGFSFTLNNSQGNVPYTAFPYIHIFAPGGAFLENKTGSSVPVSKPGSATVTLTWTPGANPDGTYNASAYVDAAAAAVCAPAGPRNVTFNVNSAGLCPPPPPGGPGGGAGGGGGAAPPAAAARPAAAGAEGVPVIEGLPFALDAPIPFLQLAPGQRAPIPLPFHIPANAPPGDRWVLIRLPGASFPSLPVLIETRPDAFVAPILVAEGNNPEKPPAAPDSALMLLRVRPRDPDRVGLSRGVTLDRTGTTPVSQISLEVQNGPKAVPRMEVVEEVPKALAADASKIKSDTPFQVIQSDPVIRFVLRDLKPNEARTIRYEVPTVLTEVRPYVYFPVKQVNVFTSVTPLRLDVKTPAVAPFTPGTRAEVRLPLENGEAFPLEVSARLETPAGWSVEPAALVQILQPGAAGLLFAVRPPGDASGPVLLTFRVETQGQEFLVQAVAQVQGSPWLLVAALAAAGGVGLFVAQRQLTLSRRRVRERAVRLIEFRQRMRRT